MVSSVCYGLTPAQVRKACEQDGNDIQGAAWAGCRLGFYERQHCIAALSMRSLTLLRLCCVPKQECAQELARCLCEGGDQPGTEAHFRIQEIISARVCIIAANCYLLSYPVPQYVPA